MSKSKKTKKRPYKVVIMNNDDIVIDMKTRGSIRLAEPREVSIRILADDSTLSDTARIQREKIYNDYYSTNIQITQTITRSFFDLFRHYLDTKFKSGDILLARRISKL